MPKGRISMHYPPMLPGRRRRPGDEADQEEHLRGLSRGYEDSPWLTALVVFSGFLVAFVGTFDTLFLLGTALTGRTWWPYAVILAALAGTHACLRAVRYGRRRARQSGTGDHRRGARSASCMDPSTVPLAQLARATSGQSRPLRVSRVAWLAGAAGKLGSGQVTCEPP